MVTHTIHIACLTRRLRLLQVFMPMNQEGNWRLAHIGLQSKKVVTYDPFVQQEGNRHEHHYHFILDCVAPNEGDKTTWGHTYAKCPKVTTNEETRLWLLRILEYLLKRLAIGSITKFPDVGCPKTDI